MDSISTLAPPALLTKFREVRSFTEFLVAPLEPEDCVLQSMPDASPTRWHLAHTTWFFETFLLARHDPGRAPFHPAFESLFNSYYNAVGVPFPRPDRGLLSRPTVAEVARYRRAVDAEVERLLEPASKSRNGSRNGAAADLDAPTRAIVELGLQHEQQHQELILTDLKHAFAQNPLLPAYREVAAPAAAPAGRLRFLEHPGGMVEVGHAGGGFAFDNEGPRHETLLRPFAIADRLVTCGEYLQFMEDGGYARPALWLDLGTATARRAGWQAPLHWFRRDGRWWLFTLGGARPVDEAEPVTHVSFFEADAYARWAGARLPTEFEWESVAADVAVEGNFVESGRLHPGAAPPAEDDRPRQLFGDAWEWTASPYLGYPGYRPPAGALGEYNGKFMCNQFVLRGGSCVSPRSHLRATYRNFFPPEARWQFSSIRLARDA